MATTLLIHANPERPLTCVVMENYGVGVEDMKELHRFTCTLGNLPKHNRENVPKYGITDVVVYSGQYEFASKIVEYFNEDYPELDVRFYQAHKND
jgi:hypothetical protein